MGRFGLKTQVALLLFLPAVVQLVVLCLGMQNASGRFVITICAVWELIGASVFCLRTIPRLQIVVDNAYRYGNGLPGRKLPGGLDEIAEIDELIQKVHLRLDSANSRYKACLSNSVDVICTLQSTFHFSMANDAVKRLWQYDPYHIVGRPVMEFVYPDDIALLKEAAAKAVESGLPGDVSVRMVKRDGTLSWTQWSISWVQTEASYFCIAKDITKQREIDLLKREFVNMVSHDLRTPLVSLSAFVEVLLSEQYGNLNERGKEMTKNCRLSIERLIRLVTDLLDLEKMEEGKFELEPCPLPISEIIHDAAATVTAFAQQKRIQIKCEGALTTEVEADPLRMVQVVQNLLSNAIKYSPAESEVIVHVESSENELLVQVKDKGPGIPSDKTDYIFDRFRQLPNSQGTGLGLAICHAIVTQHKGTIGVEKNEPQGSTFWFRMPLSLATPVTVAGSHG